MKRSYNQHRNKVYCPTLTNSDFVILQCVCLFVPCFKMIVSTLYSHDLLCLYEYSPLNLLLLLELLLSLLNDGLLDTLVLGQRDPRLVGLADDEDVVNTGGEHIVPAVAKVDDVERTGVAIDGADGADTADVSTTSDHGELADVELDVSDLFAGLDVELDGVVDLDVGVGEANRAAVMGDNIGDGTSLASMEGVAADGGLLGLGEALDAAEFVLRLLLADAVKDKAALGVIQKTELLVGLGDGDHVLEASGVVNIGAHLVVDLNLASHGDDQNLAASERITKTVTENQAKRKALAKLVRTSGRTGSLEKTKKQSTMSQY